ncbi:toxin-antitoxin system YwqK family antitoxin [Tenacibaculum salmonis]|uniref:toxin-antitoxin system YwqK family antitoxin n=1 Tax=Tenacibaculum sp. P3-BQ1 TaxID=3232310 RepID=UPI0034E03ABD
MSSIEAQELNKIDANGNRIGAWKKLYANGKTRYTGQFENGKEVGVFKFYSITSSGTPISTKTYVNGTASVKFYNEFGKLKSEGKMIGKKRSGKWVYYFPNGKPVSEENYKDGNLDGVLKDYYPNGNITQEVVYSRGKKNGLSKTFTDSAILIEEVFYVNGKLDGKANYYDLKGALKEEGMYKNGKRVGKWDFYMDGEKVDKKKKKKISDFEE